MKPVIVIVSLMLVLGSMSCKHDRKDESSSAKTQATQRPESAKTIALPHYQANLPAAPGREAFAVGCLSCHTTRYITMQPPLTAAKWEESVRKMIKTYAAPIAEDQVQPIVQYIVTALAADAGPWETPAVIAPPSRAVMETGSPAPSGSQGATMYAQ